MPQAVQPATGRGSQWAPQRAAQGVLREQLTDIPGKANIWRSRSDKALCDGLRMGKVRSRHEDEQT